MARKKTKGRAKDGPKSTPRHTQPHARWLPWQGRAWAQWDATGANRFSLADEAHFTSGHRSTAFDAGKKLRHMPISFVSAGCLEGTIKDKAPDLLEPAPSLPLNPDALAQMTIRSPSRSPSVSSVASSASSEEIVVFRGRGHTPLNPAPAMSAAASGRRVPEETPAARVAQAAAPSITAATAATSEHDTSSTGTPQLTGPSSNEQISFHVHAAVLPQEGNWSAQTTTADSSTSASVGPDATPAPESSEALQDGSDVDSDTNSVNDAIFEKRRGGKPIWLGRTTEWTSRSKPGIGWLPVRDRPDLDEFLRGEVDPKKAAMDDYMQNVEAFGLTEEMTASASFSRREMDLDAGSHNDWQESDPDQSRSQGIEDDDWNSDTLRDLDGMSTSSDVPGNVALILNKRYRTSGLQYLVVYQGSTPDDARWLSASSLKTPANRTLIQKFETDLLARPQPVTSESDSDAAFYEDEEEESHEDGEELDDETIARVLQKQEELGLGSDELLLHAADEYFGRPVGRSARAPLGAFGRPSKRRQHEVSGGRRSMPTFPSAAAMADALDMDPYGAFDIMDTERPSLRPVKKGRRGQMLPELEDSDLNDQLRATWDADRDKKRLKKAEREELRKQGLLGRKGKALDLSVKYKDGLDMMEVMEDIRGFVRSEMLTLSLPPMEAYRRAIVHQVVSQLGVNSKSRGDGAGRFTVLSKTRGTVTVDDGTFDAILEQPKFKRRLLIGACPPRRKGPKAPKAPKPKKARPTVGYKDGDVVGASAPELGPENRGRALMEKMGWSKGMALGAHDNKGILHPIAHTVKTNKAGLQ